MILKTCILIPLLSFLVVYFFPFGDQMQQLIGMEICFGIDGLVDYIPQKLAF